jgi:predicted lipoprotein with Yx(FWY)xxD motif
VAFAATIVKANDSALGKILTAPDGMTLYGFTNDIDATPTCFSTCADAWPPVIAPEDWTVAPGLDSGVFSTIIRKDGQRQLVAGKWPLYKYSNDAKPGDVKGQGSGDVWFVVSLDAKLIKTPLDQVGDRTGTSLPAPGSTVPAGATGSAAAVHTAPSSLGDILVDTQGRTLYGFTKDTDGNPTCSGGCAGTWPAVTVTGDKLPDGLDAKVFTIVARTDGTKQLKAGKWPLYRFSGDDKPGDVNGQGSGGSWFVVDPQGGLRKAAGAAAAAPAAPAPVAAKPSGY